MNPAEEEAYHELLAYTLSHGDPAFIHQYVVDAYGAQLATAGAKPIRLAFSLIGLYMHVDRGFSGREVQRVHKALGDRTHSWPALDLPPVGRRGSMSVNRRARRAGRLGARRGDRRVVPNGLVGIRVEPTHGQGIVATARRDLARSSRTLATMTHGSIRETT